MNLPEFSQRRWLQSRHYKIERDSVAVRESSVLSSRSHHVRYECISPKPEEITQSNGKIMSAALFFSVLTLVCVCLAVFGNESQSDGWAAAFLWGVFAFFCWSWFLLARVSLLIYAQHGGGLVLYADRPTREEVSRFLRRLFEARNAYLRSKYGRLSLDQPLSERLAALSMLREQEAITEEEYNRLRNLQSDGLSDSSTRIGFSR